jgi:hypothetical protein
MLLYHAIVWKYDRKHRICLRRVICTFVGTVCVSVLQHIAQYEAYHTGSPSKLFEQGLSGDGGGVVGGGGLGDVAIRYGYYRYQKHVMYVCVILLVIITQVIQEAGLRIASKTDKRLH